MKMAYTWGDPLITYDTWDDPPSDHGRAGLYLHLLKANVKCCHKEICLIETLDLPVYTGKKHTSKEPHLARYQTYYYTMLDVD